MLGALGAQIVVLAVTLKEPLGSPRTGGLRSPSLPSARIAQRCTWVTACRLPGCSMRERTRGTGISGVR